MCKAGTAKVGFKIDTVNRIQDKASKAGNNDMCN